MVRQPSRHEIIIASVEPSAILNSSDLHARRTARAKAARKPSTKPRGEAGGALGRLPKWNLADLYPAIDAPEVKRDLDRADTECAAFEETYKGKLGALAAGRDVAYSFSEIPMKSPVREPARRSATCPPSSSDSQAV